MLRREAVEWLREHGESRTCDVAAALGVSLSDARDALQEACRVGEVAGRLGPSTGAGQGDAERRGLWRAVDTVPETV